MRISSSYRITAPTPAYYIEVTPEALSLSAYNVASTTLRIRFWANDGENRNPYSAWLTLQVRSGESVLYTYRPSVAVTGYEYTWPSSQYAEADNILVVCHSNSARTVEVGRKTVSLVCENPIVFPRPETAWSSSLTFKNGEVIMLDDTVYMWCSRVAGNTSVNPKTYIANGTLPRVWAAYQNWPLLCTQMFLAQFAKIGSAVFMGDYMLSQYGKNSGGSTITDYRQFDPSKLGKAGCPFTPRVYVDWKTGKVYMDLAEVAGTIKAEDGTIGGFEIHDGYIGVAGNLTSYGFGLLKEFIKFSTSDGIWSGIGTNVLGMGQSAVARFEDYRTEYLDKIAMIVGSTGAQGAARDIAVNITGGYVSGFALKPEIVSTSKTLDRSVNVVCTINESAITITLPKMKQYDDGHLIRFKRLGGGDVNIKVGVNQPLEYDQGNIMDSNASVKLLSSDGDAFDLVFIWGIKRSGYSRDEGRWIQFKHPRDW